MLSKVIGWAMLLGLIVMLTNASPEMAAMSTGEKAFNLIVGLPIALVLIATPWRKKEGA